RTKFRVAEKGSGGAEAPPPRDLFGEADIVPIADVRAIVVDDVSGVRGLGGGMQFIQFVDGFAHGAPQREKIVLAEAVGIFPAILGAVAALEADIMEGAFFSNACPNGRLDVADLNARDQAPWTRLLQCFSLLSSSCF